MQKMWEKRISSFKEKVNFFSNSNLGKIKIKEKIEVK